MPLGGHQVVVLEVGLLAGSPPGLLGPSPTDPVPPHGPVIFSRTCGSDSTVGLDASTLTSLAERVAWSSDFSAMFWSLVCKA